MYFFIEPARFNCPFKLEDYFETHRSFNIEIGFGNGDFTVSMAEKYPHENFLGIELSSRSLYKIYKKIKARGLNNIKIIKMDAWTLLALLNREHTVSRIIANFPDPWPGKAQNRITNKDHLKLIHRALKSSGHFYTATDSRVLKQELEQNAQEFFVIEKSKLSFFEHMTKYENKWLSMGRGITYYRLSPASLPISYPKTKEVECMSHVIYDCKDIIRMDAIHGISINERYGENIIKAETPFTRMKGNEYLFPFIVKEDELGQKFLIKVTYVNNQLRITIYDTSYLIITKGVRLAMHLLARKINEKIKNLILKEDKTGIKENELI